MRTSIPNRILAWVIVLGCGLGSSSLYAQLFTGFQSINTDAFYVTLSWQGDKPYVGAGYWHRFSGRSFTDLQLEYQFPLTDPYSCENFQFTGGIYKPLEVQKSFIGVGGHLRWRRERVNTAQHCWVEMVGSVLPSYAYARDLGDGVYSTAALRLSYAEVIYAQVKDPVAEVNSQPVWLSGRFLELGGHLDFQIERNLLGALDGYVRHPISTSTSLPESEDWSWEGKLHLGASYHLRR